MKLISKHVSLDMVEKKICPFCGGAKRRGGYSCLACYKQGGSGQKLRKIVEQVLEALRVSVRIAGERQDRRTLLGPVLAALQVGGNPQLCEFENVSLIRKKQRFGRGEGYIPVYLFANAKPEEVKDRTLTCLVEVVQRNDGKVYIGAQRVAAAEADVRMAVISARENSVLFSGRPHIALAWTTPPSEDCPQGKKLEATVGFLPA